MTIFDYIVLVIVGLSVLISLMRGGVREALSIAGWLVAFYVARTYASTIAPMLPAEIPAEQLKIVAAFVILFLVVLLISSLLSTALAGLLKIIRLGWINRLFGALFGFARGLLIVGILVMLAGMTEMPKDERWTNAMLSAPLEAMVKNVLPWLPESITKYVSFD